ncbi:MAG TPA: radical SAM protein [Methanomicrobia archaeon]|nr:radical SAM protein [Methanomicrobia archaeon]
MKSPSTRLTVAFGGRSKDCEVIQHPIPHILVDSNKQLHGWWNGIEPYGNRECTAERLLINPYNGCSHNCRFCYSHALGGYFTAFREHGILTVFRDFNKRIAQQLDSLSVVSCGYLSPVTDPFQPLNERYELTEKILKEFVARNIPVQVTTKGRISERALGFLKQQEHAFGAISLLTPDEDKRQHLMAGGASTEELVRNIERLANAGTFAVCRIDPVIPCVTDNRGDLEELVRNVVEAGAGHIITSCLDIPVTMKHEFCTELAARFGVSGKQLVDLYSERMGGRLHARLDYRRKLFTMIRTLCDRNGVTMSLCMEFASVQGKRVRGLNAEFMSANRENCEGINVPLYVRPGEGKRFEPVAGCNGSCLQCYFANEAPACGIADLKQAGAWKLRDYRRWSAVVRARSGEQRRLDV